MKPVLKCFTGVTRSGKFYSDMVFQGSSLVLFSVDNFSLAWYKCCFTDFPTLPRTHFWGKYWQKSPPVSHRLPVGEEKNCFFYCTAHFKGEKKANAISPLSLSNHILPGICVSQSEYLHFIFYHYFVHLSQICVDE